MKPIRSGQVPGLGDERGSTIVFVSLAMAALLSIVALAVDIGMLFTARGEAQRAADSAALAGAAYLINHPGDSDGAKAEAVQFGELNDVQGVSLDLEPDDVEVDLAEERVRVTAHRDGIRGGPVLTWFARVFGTDAVNVNAIAAAKIEPAGSARCVKPFSLYDRFLGDGDWTFDPGDSYDPAIHGYGSDWRNPGSPGDDGLGYLYDFGREIVLYGGGPGAGPNEETPGTGPSWYLPWDVPQTEDGNCNGGPIGQGANCYEWAIENCHPAIISVGQQYQVETGAMPIRTKNGVLNLISDDANAYWDETCNCVMNSRYGDNWDASKRVGIIPTFDPSREFDPGNKPIEFTNFLAVWFDRVVGGGNNMRVYGRILHPTGIMGGNVDAAPNAKGVRLVE
ncbi:MAG: pilus assembly protein TadG-related protein [Gemmatimonadota bacterium]